MELRRRIGEDRQQQPEENLSGDRRTRGRFRQLPTILGLAVPLVVLLLLKITVYMDTALPRQVKISEEELDRERFIGERAELYLKDLVDIGPRLVGSYQNEHLAVDYVTNTVNRIIRHSNGVHTYDVDIQRPQGSYYLEFKPFGIRNYYANIQNIVVRVSSVNSSKHAVLINCHYDTVIQSPGAMDNGFSCAIMLELLTKVTQFKEPMTNDIIFLFNGAEENPLQGSHGFIVHHKWAHQVRVVINLDNCGSGGKMLLFQTYRFPWLTQVYAASVPYPTTSVTFEEMFQSNIVPSDTDFRIFRDYGNVPGFDFAFYENGYVYHTRLDTMKYIPPGTYQHGGDNVLALLRALVYSPQLQLLADRTEPDKAVFYDLFGVFVVVYTEQTALILNIVCCMLSLATVITTFKMLPGTRDCPYISLLKTTSIQLTAWILASCYLILTAKFLDWINATMTWYTHHFVIILIYYIPVLAIAGAVPALFVSRKSTTNFGEKTAEYLNSVQFLWTIVLFIGTVYRVRSMYLTLLFVMLPAIGNVCLLARPNKLYTVERVILVYVIGVVIPIMGALHLSYIFFTVMIPASGRAGPHVNPELVMAGITIVFGLHICSYLTPLFLILKNPVRLTKMFLLLNIVTILVVVLTPLGFPYRGDAEAPRLQRFNLIHTERTFYNQLGDVRRHDSGYWLLHRDRNRQQYLAKVLPEVAESRDMTSDCELELYCAAPLFQSRMVSYVSKSSWIPSKTVPFVSTPTQFQLVKQEDISNTLRRYYLKITGSDHMAIYLSPVHGVELLRWSFDDQEPRVEKKWNGRKTYFINYSHGLNGGTLEFSMDVRIPEDNKPSHVLDISMVGHNMHDKHLWTDEFKDLLNRFPEWTSVKPWTATYKSWVI